MGDYCNCSRDFSDCSNFYGRRRAIWGNDWQCDEGRSRIYCLCIAFLYYSLWCVTFCKKDSTYFIKIRYFDFLSSLEYEGCNAALKRIGPRLDMEQICRLIDETPCLSGLQRRFYKEILALRKERIIDYSLQRLQERERSMLPGHKKKPSRDTER